MVSEAGWRRVVESLCGDVSSFRSPNWVKIMCQHVAIVFNPWTSQMMQKLLLLPVILRRLQGSLLMYRFRRNSTLQETKQPTGKSGYRFGKRTKLSLGWTNNLQRFASPRLSRVSVQMLWKYPLDCHFRRMMTGKTSTKCLNCGRIIA